MSLAAATSAALSLIDAATLKPNAAPSDSKPVSLSAAPVAIAWTPDNNSLYVASTHAIHAFSSARLTPLYSADAPLGSTLVARDSSTLIFTQGSAIHLLAVSTRPPKITASITAHSTPVTSLALSSDASLLASASASGALHVYNLTHNANTVLRSFPGASRARCVCVFDPHLRTRLFVGASTTLVAYDTARGTLVKTVALAEKSASSDVGHVVAISPSPYSKTLVAVACTTFLGLVDLEKEKPLFKTIPVKTPVTSMTFTADGSSLAVGTETGKLLVYDLRNIERPSRLFDIGAGDRVVALSIQKRVKGATAPRISASQSAPLTSTKSPVRRPVSARTPTTPGGRTKKEVASSPSAETGNTARVIRVASNEAIAAKTETVMGAGGRSSAQGARASSVSSLLPPERPSSRGVRSRSRASSDVSAAPPHADHRPRGESHATRAILCAPATRTPTPELPSVDRAESPMPPWTGLRTVANSNNTYVTTPDVDRWIEAGRAKPHQRRGAAEKRVGWAEPESSDKENNNSLADAAPAPRSVDVDMSPVRRAAGVSSSEMQVSPVRGNGGAQDLLRAVVKDVIYDYREETRGEIKGLHLDLLKMGRSWKKELRTIMDEYVGDLRELREENARLRAENDRLRRGH